MDLHVTFRTAVISFFMTPSTVSFAMASDVSVIFVSFYVPFVYSAIYFLKSCFFHIFLWPKYCLCPSIYFESFLKQKNSFSSVEYSEK